MDWIRNWIMQIAGIIVLGSICDNIMTDGEMKKYVKMVVGIILIFAVIKPIVNFSPDIPELKLPDEARTRAVELQRTLDDKEQQEVFRIYRGKLEKNVENRILSRWNRNSTAQVTVEEKDEATFGSVKSIWVEISDSKGIDSEEVRKVLGTEFGVDSDNIRIELR